MKALLAGIALLLVASTATAADANGWYAGIGGGQSELRNVCSGAGAVIPLDECDEQSVAWKVLLGRNLSKIWGIEFSYVDAGEAKVTASASAGTLVVNPRILVAFGVLKIPLGNHLGIFAKAGLAYFNTTFERTNSFRALSSGDDGVEGALGAGVSWRGWKHVSVRAEWEHFRVLDETPETDSDA